MANQNSILPKNVSDTEAKARKIILSNSTNNLLDNNGIASPNANPQNNNAVLGKSYLNSLYPDEIEYYACAFELVDSNGNAVEFFSFPVMPNSMTEQFQTIASIKKTFGGVVVNKNSTFIPFNIQVSGDFGRRFRNVYSGNKIDSINGNNKQITNNNLNQKKDLQGNTVTSFFDTDNKTGYGSTKILESIFKKSLKVDDYGGSYNLYFYNLSFNSKYNVEVINFNFSQNRDRNMIWTYSFSLRAIAPALNTRNYQKVSSSIQNIRSLDSINNEAKQQANSLNPVLLDPKNKISKVEKILYNVSSNVNHAATKFGSDNPKALNAINEVISLAKNQNRTFIATVGVDISNGIQRADFLTRKIIGEQ